ncbi:MAG: phage tail sheath subtilisin-like domain-containing protein [Clostridiales bacterium]
MLNYLSSESYIEEFEMGTRPFKNANTGTAGFIGLAQKGPVEGKPLKVTSITDFFRKFGGYLTEEEFGNYRYLSYTVEQFFANGGLYCQVMRVIPKNAKASVNSERKRQVVKLKAVNPGTWGNKINVKISKDSKARTKIVEKINNKKFRLSNRNGFNVGDIVAFVENDICKYNKIISLENDIVELKSSLRGNVIDNESDSIKYLQTCEFRLEIKYEDSVEVFEKLSLNKNSLNFVESVLKSSKIINVEIDYGKIDRVKDPFVFITNLKKESETTMYLKGGSNGDISEIYPENFIGDNNINKETGINSFIDNDEVSVLSIPGVSDVEVQKKLIEHCEMYANKIAVLDISNEKNNSFELQNYKELFNSDFAAVYHPWIKIFDPLCKKNISIPPSGSVLGIYSRTDIQRGVHKAPVNEIIKNTIGLNHNYNRNEYDLLETKGINLIRSFAGQGIRLWCYRTLGKEDKCEYINEKRLIIFIIKSIGKNLKWASINKNSEELQIKVKNTIDLYLTDIWRKGVLAGNSPKEAFLTEIKNYNVKDNKIEFQIKVAPTKKSEFVSLKYVQETI